jgi:hypothetical protein
MRVFSLQNFTNKRFVLSFGQSGASYCSSPGAADFHRASLNFYFPPNVSIAGRVWKSGCTEVLFVDGLFEGTIFNVCYVRQWHEDVSVLPTTVFLRAELAHQTELKAAFAMPLCKDSRVIAVCIFYSRYALPSNQQVKSLLVVEIAVRMNTFLRLICDMQIWQMEQTCLAIANEILISMFARR